MKKVILVVAVILAALAALFFLFSQKAANYNSPAADQEQQGEIPAAARVKISALKESVFLPVPFTSQAPFGLWAPPYNEACEEANLVMAMRWARGQALTLDDAAREIVALAVFENKIFGFNEDTNIEQTAQLLKDYYRYENLEVRKNVASIEEIKKELNAGNIVLIPVAGKLLNNPHFTPPGPDYHMLLIRGYDDNARTFIVNDPGTKFGNGYAYNYLTVDQAWHDWTGSALTILQGGRNLLVIRRSH